VNVFIIIPAYNEEGNIKELLESVRKMKTPGTRKQVILVDDGSVDKTLEIAESYKNKLKLHILIHKKNLGIPITFYDGLKKASELSSPSDVIFIIEGDNTSDLKILPEMLKKIKSGKDIVVASRYLLGGGYKRFPFHRVLGSKIINYTLKLFFYHKNITDYTIFYRAYSAKCVKEAFKKYKSDLITVKSFAANLELLIKVGEFSNANDEVPFVYDYGLKKGKSKIKITKTLWAYKSLIIKRIFGKIILK
jgi:dolichol-phosphate mannosyltransferase